MAWGMSSNVDWLGPLCARIASGEVTSLHVLPARKITGKWCQLAETLALNPALTELYASGHRITPSEAEAAANALKSNTHLTSLCLGDAQFGNEGLSTLAAGVGVSGVLHLDLENKSITQPSILNGCSPALTHVHQHRI